VKRLHISWDAQAADVPMQNGYVESVEGRMLGVLFNETLFTSVDHVRKKIAASFG
jgi:hypothetical protein